MNQSYFHIISDGIVRNIYHPTSGFLQGASYQELNKKQLMDLLTAKKEIVAQSRKDPKKVFYLDVDTEGEVSVATTFTKNQSCYAYRNGSEIALPDTSTTPEPKANKRTKTKATANDKVDVEQPEPDKEKGEKKLTKPVTEGISSTKTTAGAAKPKKSMATKTKAKKSAKKAATKTAAKKAPATKKTGMPEGKRMTITVKKALELAKKGAYVYRASNGSPFGEYYLEKVKNKDHAMDLIIRQ